ncbi:DNA polymerase I [Pseudalkalibacillus berkeleyi]|uniref:DNA polymerase I n=1 Tax=Pseudalkalibacillus berkeleyi TaxID=1069813 RepID=A0ABS9GZL8_9BACL|nr:DNA polymerase I [Pseudalkalibacillus berkeleyi]MCF6138193.1 DNA polymerase I [Pseudalkalibacillus berkeleyi]
MSKKKLVLIDGNSIAYRAFFALPLLNNDKGVYTNAVYGFTTMLLKVLEDEAPSHILVAFDAGKTTFRHKTYGEYKGGRQKTPPELSEQFPLIRELLDAFDIKRYELENYEADDIIGTLSKQTDASEWEVKVITGDKDLLQLVDEHVKVSLTKKGITDVDTYDLNLVEERYGLKPEQIIDMKGLMGDSSDNIPGVPGVGEKTAIKLLKEFGTVEKVLESIDQVSGKKLKEKLEDNKEQAEMSKKLATIEVDAPIEIKLDTCGYKKDAPAKVVELFKELGFNSLIDRVDSEAAKEAELPSEDIEYEVLSEITDSDFGSEAAVVVECLEENYHNGDILGFGIVSEKGKYFIPTDVALQSELFKSWLEDETIIKYMPDAKQATVSLAWEGIKLRGVRFDALIASYLLNPSDSSHDIPSIATRLGLKRVSSNETIYGKGAKQKVPSQDELSEHIVRKADSLLEMVPTLQESLKKNELDVLYYDLEMPLSIVLGEMEHQGVQVDVERLEQMGKDLNEQLQKIESKIHELAGTAFNINSPKQLGEVLFEKLQLPVIKKTKTGYSTNADVLEKLKDKHEIIEEILFYRQLGKLNSTYVEGLLKVVHRDTEKIHTRFNQALAQTGRLSSIDPNLQNIPIRLEAGRKIRQAFIPSEKDWVMFAADYSQIELRVLAHIAQDDKMIEAFNNEEDVHTKTAMDVFHVGKDEVTSDMRRQAKAVNFGIVYGISDYGLSQSLGITRKEAGAFIERYLESFPGVKQYMDDIVQQAKQDGYVTTMLNRRRYLPEITSRNFNLRSFAERTAMNTPIQGTAADIIKKAMVEMAKRLDQEKLQTRMLLQVHDELIFEAPKDEIEKLEKIVPDVMEHAIQIDVPLKVDYSYGDTWYDSK